MTNTKLITLAAAAIASLSIGGIAQASSDETPRQMAIDVSTADLASPAAMERLNLRIRRAARQVCFITNGSGLTRTPHEQQCFRQTLANANQRVAALRSSATDGQLAIAQPVVPATR